MLQEYYLTIGIVVAILFFNIVLLNLTFDFTRYQIFTGFIKIHDDNDKFAAAVISLLTSIFLAFIWIIFVPFLLLYIIIKLITSINYKYMWKEIGLWGHAARLARDNQYNKQ